jgi:hypothetical protein
MKQLLLAASTMALAIALSAPAFAETSNADCKAIFHKADFNNDDWLRGDEAKLYLSAMDKAGLKRANADGKLNEGEFIAACEKDVFKDVGK